MKILFISLLPADSWGGSEELWKACAEAALRKGHRVMASAVAAPVFHENYLQLQAHGAVLHHRVTQAPIPSLLQRITHKITGSDGFQTAHTKVYQAFLETVRQFDPDIVCITQGGAFNVVGKPELMFLIDHYETEYFIIGHCNDEVTAFSENARKNVLAMLEKINTAYFISHRNLQVAKRQLASPRFTNYQYLKNPVKFKRDTPLPYPQNAVVQWGVVARLHCNSKGHHLLFEALANEKWKQRSWQLNLYGEGPDKQYMIDLCHWYGISDKVIFKGFQNDVEAIWRENHLFVLPSVTEGTPLSIVEAMLCGRACITTDVGDNGVLVQPFTTGFLAPAPVPTLIEQALEQAWQRQNEWEQLGHQAFRFIQAFIDWQAGDTLLNAMIEKAQKPVKQV